MSKIVLIHGNAVGIKFHNIRDRETKYGSFSIFKPLVDAGQAVLYGWHFVNEEFDLFQSLNPFEFRRQYFTEKKYCSSNQAWQKLDEFLNAEQPEKIVCHSMGCYLLLLTLNSQGLPTSVKSVYLAQGDFDRNFKITNSTVLDRLASGDLKIYNYYCPWDQMLALSVGVNGKAPGGLAGAKEKYFINKLFTKTETTNFHHATICSDEFLQEVLS
jgi:hypothetical protein